MKIGTKGIVKQPKTLNFSKIACLYVMCLGFIVVITGCGGAGETEIPQV